ncbi:MAG: hypothetical protein FWG98_00370 [Candidatus Cloacimonetes bacterium]|nr:hypothetical protein [Candidatus Cloacimonadota bacterium]
MKTKILLIYLVTLTLLACITNYDDDNVQRSRIADRLKMVEEAFNWSTTDSIMNNYHPDFLHFGDDFHTQKIIWNEIKIFFPRMDIEILDIEIIGDYAIASFLLNYWDNTEARNTFPEPESFGYMSYFIYDRGEWWIYGNQKK